jgi:hypothetical protein
MMTEFEKQRFLNLLAETRAKQDAEVGAEVEDEMKAEEEAVRQERLQWAQNRKKEKTV